MKKLTFLILLFTLLIPDYSIGQAKRPKKDKRTPFSKVIYKNNHPYILENNTWVKLVSIEEKAVEEYIEIANLYNATDWKHAFHRWIHYIMDEMGIKRENTVKVTYELNGKRITKNFELKKENRELATKFHDSIMGQNRIRRNHTNKIPEEYKYLTKRLYVNTPEAEDWLTREEALHDLEYLEREIDHNYSYANLTGYNYKLALDAIISGLDDGITARDLAFQLKQFMANFGDGHSRVSLRDVADKTDYKQLPFIIVKHNNAFYAIDPNKKTYYNTHYKRIKAINNIPIEKYYTQLQKLISKTTSKFVERNTTDYLNITAFALRLMGETNLNEANVTFTNGSDTKSEKFELKKQRMPSLVSNHILKDTILKNNIGYLAFNKRMMRDDEFIEGLHRAMQKFKNTEGLIIDIRRNGGGNRAPLKALLPYFIKEAKVVNVARYRIDKNKDLKPKSGYLDARYSYPENIDITLFEKKEEKNEIMEFKKAVTKFKSTFAPSVEVSKDKFTDYHYMVVTPTTTHHTYYYDKPVIVLIDEGCFSASDIFAAGIRTGDQVELLGNTTGGGSGYSKSKRLPNSRFKVRLSRMFSYQPNGATYDGKGVIPDIKIDYTLEDKLGKTDSQLKKAMDILSKTN